MTLITVITLITLTLITLITLITLTLMTLIALITLTLMTLITLITPTLINPLLHEFYFSTKFLSRLVHAMLNLIKTTNVFNI